MCNTDGSEHGRPRRHLNTCEQVCNRNQGAVHMAPRRTMGARELLKGAGWLLASFTSFQRGLGEASRVSVALIGVLLCWFYVLSLGGWLACGSGGSG